MERQVNQIPAYDYFKAGDYKTTMQFGKMNKI